MFFEFVNNKKYLKFKNNIEIVVKTTRVDDVFRKKKLQILSKHKNSNHESKHCESKLKH